MCCAVKNVILTYAQNARIEYALKNVQAVINYKYVQIQILEDLPVIAAKKVFLKSVPTHSDARNVTMMFAMIASSKNLLCSHFFKKNRIEVIKLVDIGT